MLTSGEWSRGPGGLQGGLELNSHLYLLHSLESWPPAPLHEHVFFIRCLKKRADEKLCLEVSNGIGKETGGMEAVVWSEGRNHVSGAVVWVGGTMWETEHSSFLRKLGSGRRGGGERWPWVWSSGFAAACTADKFPGNWACFSGTICSYPGLTWGLPRTVSGGNRITPLPPPHVSPPRFLWCNPKSPFTQDSTPLPGLFAMQVLCPRCCPSRRLTLRGLLVHGPH